MPWVTTLAGSSQTGSASGGIHVTRAGKPTARMPRCPIGPCNRAITEPPSTAEVAVTRGMTVVGADGESGGIARDLWVDRSEPQFRYLEVEVNSAGGTRRVLVPMLLVRVDGRRRRVTVKSVLGRHFADAPGLANPDQVTLREEDRVCAYFGSGNLYALPSRQEPLL